MTDWPYQVWLQKKVSMTHQQSSLGGVLQTFIHQFVDGILCTLSPDHNVHMEKGVYQQWTTYVGIKLKQNKDKTILIDQFTYIDRLNKSN